MQFVFIFIFHLIRAWLTLFRPGGVKALTWENMALRQQFIVLQRKQKRAPHLTMWDRFCLFNRKFLNTIEKSSYSNKALNII